MSIAAMPIIICRWLFMRQSYSQFVFRPMPLDGLVHSYEMRLLGRGSNWL